MDEVISEHEQGFQKVMIAKKAMEVTIIVTEMIKTSTRSI